VDDTRPYNKAGLTYRAGLAHDSENQELKNGLRRAVDAFEKSTLGVGANELLEQAQADPQVDAILSDPAMQQVVIDIVRNANAATSHMQNPEVAAKVRKLAAKGILPPSML